MLRWIQGLVLALVLGTAAVADEGAIRDVIRDQIAAFERDDWEAGFDHASPTIQGIFGTAQRFGAMVQGGYPMVWRPKELGFGPLREVAGGLWQRVEIIDQQGQLHLLDYQMVRLGEAWKINAVQLLKPPPLSA